MATRQTVQPRIVNHTVDLFKGGMDSDASPYSVVEGQAVLGKNIEFYRDNTLRSRKGYVLDLMTKRIGSWITHRVGGQVLRFFKMMDDMNDSENSTPIIRAGSPNGFYKFVTSQDGTHTFTSPHTFLRGTNSTLYVDSGGVYSLTSNQYGEIDLNRLAINNLDPLILTTSPGGDLKEGFYNYSYNFTLQNGVESQLSEEVQITVPPGGHQVRVQLPTTSLEWFELKKARYLNIYRRGPDDGYGLLIKQYPVIDGSISGMPGEYDEAYNWISFVDDRGLKQSAMMATQGIRVMPGGTHALIHNRRLITVLNGTMNYSYPGNYGYGNVFWTEKVNLPTGEGIKSICPLGQGVIFFGLETAIYMNAFPSEGGTFNPIPIPDGCVAQTAWTQAEDGTLLYVGKSGVYAMQGATAQRISDPVNDYFRKYSVGELSDVTIVFDQQERRLLVALPQEILVYYFQTKAWSVWTLPNASLNWFEGQIHFYIEEARVPVQLKMPVGSPINIEEGSGS